MSNQTIQLKRGTKETYALQAVDQFLAPGEAAFLTDAEQLLIGTGIGDILMADAGALAELIKFIKTKFIQNATNAVPNDAFMRYNNVEEEWQAWDRKSLGIYDVGDFNNWVKVGEKKFVNEIVDWLVSVDDPRRTKKFRIIFKGTTTDGDNVVCHINEDAEVKYDTTKVLYNGSKEDSHARSTGFTVGVGYTDGSLWDTMIDTTSTQVTATAEGFTKGEPSVPAGAGLLSKEVTVWDNITDPINKLLLRSGAAVNGYIEVWEWQDLRPTEYHTMRLVDELTLNDEVFDQEYMIDGEVHDQLVIRGNFKGASGIHLQLAGDSTPNYLNAYMYQDGQSVAAANTAANGTYIHIGIGMETSDSGAYFNTEMSLGSGVPRTCITNATRFDPLDRDANLVIASGTWLDEDTAVDRIRLFTGDKITGSIKIYKLVKTHMLTAGIHRFATAADLSNDTDVWHGKMAVVLEDPVLNLRTYDMHTRTWKVVVAEDSAVTFDTLMAKGQVGPGESQVARGNHTHDSRYPLKSEMDGKANVAHEHDGRYYTETETDAKLATKSDTTHNHHDEHYLKAEVDTKLGTKSDVLHDHDGNYYLKAQVDQKFADLAASAPETLNTLNELAAALGDDPNFATTITTELGKKLDKTAKAADSSKLEGLAASKFWRTDVANYAHCRIGPHHSIYATSGNWSTNAQRGEGKIQYHDDSWYVASTKRSDGSNNADIIRFMHEGAVKSRISIDGVFQGKALTAGYGDLAEKYTIVEGDQPVGTVICATRVPKYHAEVCMNEAVRVLGTIAKQPAVLMNSECPVGQYVTRIGINPVRVTGMVNKGDRLVAAGNGVARAIVEKDHADYWREEVMSFATANETFDGGEEEGIVIAIM